MQDLIHFSRLYGAQPAHVQAGGGNTSEKHADGLMTVKASGSYLSDVSDSHGFVTLPKHPIVTLFSDSSPPDEQRYNQVIQDIKPQNAPRPSMESGFHALLPTKFVLHTHSALMAILLCSDQGEPLLKQLSERINLTILDYITPGIPLSYAIGKLPDPPPVILLRNHGIIVCGDTQDDIVSRYDNVHETVRAIFAEQQLKLPAFPEIKVNPSNTGFRGTSYPEQSLLQTHFFSEQLDQILCPDQAIYFSLRDTYTVDEQAQQIHYELTERNAFAVEQMAIFIRYIHQAYKMLSWTPRYIPTREITRLLKLDSEKYRQRR